MVLLLNLRSSKMQKLFMPVVLPRGIIENTGWIYKGQLTYGLSFYEAEKMDDLPNYYHPYSIC
ncbi:MAG: hypothetical protein ACOCXD_01420 [Bacteroidota bacterium]